MAVSLNTGDALYSALSHLFLVDDDNTIKELKAGLTCTPHANVLLPGTGATTSPVGRSFRTGGAAGGSPAVYGVDFPNYTASNAADISFFCAINQYNSANNGGNSTYGVPMFGTDTGGIRIGVGMQVDVATGKVFHSNTNGVAALSGTLNTSGSITGGSVKSFGFTRTAAGVVKVYINGVVDTAYSGGIANTGSQFGAAWGTAEHSLIGGFAGYGWASFDYAYVADFLGTVVSESEMLRLHDSLTGSSAFALVTLPADTTAPVLTVPTGTSTGTTTATGSVTTDEANGTLYRLASTNATELAATVKAAALTQAVSATGSQAVTFTGLTPSTTYYAHYVHTDAAANDSTRVSSASFTTSGAGPTINTQPAAQTANEAATATFTVAATTSGGALSYQWKRQPPGGGAFANVGTNSTSYTTATLDCATDHGANVYCAVTDSNGTTNTNTVGLTVLAITSTVRPIADIATAGWVASTGADFYALIDEAVADDVDYITSPAVSVTPEPIKFSLSYPWAAGTRRIRFNAKGNGGTPTMRVKLLNDADTVVGTSAGQVVTAIWAAYDIEIVLSGTATRGTIEFVS